MSSFGDRVRRLRESAWLTQAELAERAGVSERTISDLERGLRSSVYPSTARALAEALGIHRGDFLEFVRTARPTRRHAAVQGSITAAIPQPMTGMLGRDQELAAVRHLVRRPEVRLATILGPGGIGKTRLALELARSEDAAFGNAVHFVEGLVALRYRRSRETEGHRPSRPRPPVGARGRAPRHSRAHGNRREPVPDARRYPRLRAGAGDGSP